MWSKAYSKRVKGLSAGQVWKVWSDVNQWPSWQDDIEYAKLDGEFERGNTIRFKPKGGLVFKIKLTRVEPKSAFDDLTNLPLAKMRDSHELIDHGEELEIRTTISISGPLSYIWRKFFVENVASGMREQTDRLIEKAQDA
jgi:hypothetical protein